MITADWRDIENNVASKVYVKRFKYKETGIEKLQDALTFSLRRWFPKTRKSRTTSNLTPPESGELRRSTLGEASELLCSAQGETSEADRDAVEREDYWSVSGKFIDRHRALP